MPEIYIKLKPAVLLCEYFQQADQKPLLEDYFYLPLFKKSTCASLWWRSSTS